MASAMLLRGEDYEAGLTQDEGPGQISSASREVYEMMCVCQGSAEYWIEDQHYKLVAGDVLLIPVGVMVGATLKARGCPYQRVGVWLSRRYMTFLQLQDDEADFSFSLAGRTGHYLLRLPSDSREHMTNAFLRLAEDCKSKEINAELSTKAALAALCVRINRLVREKGELVLLPGDENRLAPVLSYIHQNCTSPISVEALSAQFSYSPSHLAHSFKRHTGISLYHYVLLRRLQIGRAAMLGGTPVKDTYLKCGFGDYAGFYRAFMKEFGLSPQQYKKRNQ